MRYKNHNDGDVVIPVMRGYKMRCCDCNLIHVIDFFVVKRGRRNEVQFRIRRDNRATAAARRKA